MFLLTLAVGALFIFQTAPQDNRVAELQTLVAGQRGTIQFYERQPTLPPTPTRQATLAAPDAFSSGVNPTSVPSAIVIPTTTPQVFGGEVVNVQASRDVNPNGCADSPDTVFEPFDAIYGVATFSNMGIGDIIQVQFNYDSGGSLIYEEEFTIQQPGSFCRWYIIEPDSVGWETGNYSISYRVNQNPPVSVSYQINSASDEIPDATEENTDAMTEEEQSPPP